MKKFWILAVLIVTGCDPYLGISTTVPHTVSEPHALEPKEAHALHELSERYLNEPNLTSDLADIANKIKKAAEQGDRKAQYELGKIYFDGSGTPQDLTKAAKWFKKAAENGFAKAQYHLGITYMHIAIEAEVKAIIKKESNTDYEKTKQDAFKWLELAYPKLKQFAESEDPEAQFMLTRLYMAWDAIKDENKAAEWREKALENFKKAAELGSVKAQRNIAEIYSFYPINEIEMVKWYRKAAEQEDAIAQYRLGSHYKVTKKYHAQAIEWLKKAAQRGHFEAQYELGQIFDSGAWTPEDDTQIKAFHNDIEAIK